MTQDMRTFGAADIGEGYYLIRQGGTNGLTVASIRIDPLGNVHGLATTSAASWTQEELAAMPTRSEAIEQHLAPAFREAEARLQAEVERRRRDGPPAMPTAPPVDPATARFLDDEDWGSYD